MILYPRDRHQAPKLFGGGSDSNSNPSARTGSGSGGSGSTGSKEDVRSSPSPHKCAKRGMTEGPNTNVPVLGPSPLRQVESGSTNQSDSFKSAYGTRVGIGYGASIKDDLESHSPTTEKVKRSVRVDPDVELATELETAEVKGSYTAYASSNNVRGTGTVPPHSQSRPELAWVALLPAHSSAGTSTGSSFAAEAVADSR